MLNADAIEAINFEQLVTPTDRLLLRGARLGKRRPSIPSLAYLASPPVPPPPAAPLARGSRPHIVRPRAARYSLAATVVLPTLLGIAVGLAAML